MPAVVPSDRRRSASRNLAVSLGWLCSMRAKAWSRERVLRRGAIAKWLTAKPATNSRVAPKEMARYTTKEDWAAGGAAVPGVGDDPAAPDAGEDTAAPEAGA